MSSNSKAANIKSSVAEPKLREEDGWIFRERPGMPVQCIHRAEEVQADDMTQPNEVRHNYPSA